MINFPTTIINFLIHMNGNGIENKMRRFYLKMSITKREKPFVNVFIFSFIESMEKIKKEHLADFIYLSKSISGSTERVSQTRAKSSDNIFDGICGDESSFRKFVPNMPSGQQFDIYKIPLRVQKIFDSAGIDCVVGGSIALMMSRMEPRVTKDVDCNLRYRDSSKQNSPISEEEIKAIIKPHSDIKLVSYHKATISKKFTPHDLTFYIANLKVGAVPVELFLNPNWPIAKEIFNKPKKVDELLVAPPECICAFKAMTPKESNRHNKDITDIKNLMSNYKNLDLKWTRDLILSHCHTDSKLLENWDKMTERKK